MIPRYNEHDIATEVMAAARDHQGVPLYLYRCTRCGIQATTYSAVEANTWHACDCTAFGRRPRFKRVKDPTEGTQP